MKTKAYAIDFRNMHTAIHGLFVFPTKELAKKGEKIIQNGNGFLTSEAFEMLDECMSQYYYTEIDYHAIDKDNCFYDCGITYKIINPVAYDLIICD